jgi:hypothetical protein
MRQRISGIGAEFSVAKQAAGARAAAVKRIADDMSFAVRQFSFISDTYSSKDRQRLRFTFTSSAS